MTSFTLGERITNIVSMLNGNGYTHNNDEPPRTHTMPRGMDDGELFTMMEQAGLTRSGGYVLTDDKAYAKLQDILSSGHAPAVMYDALHCLDVEIQNHGESYAVINDVLAAQWQLVEQMMEHS